MEYSGVKEVIGTIKYQGIVVYERCEQEVYERSKQEVANRAA